MRRKVTAIKDALTQKENAKANCSQGKLLKELATVSSLKDITPEHIRAVGEIMAEETYKKIVQALNLAEESDPADGVLISKGFVGLTVSIGTTPAPIVAPDNRRPYLFLNPASETLGQTTSDIVSAVGTALTETTNTTEIDVAGVEDLHIFFNPTVITGSWSVFVQAKDPVTGDWADTQKLFDTDDADIADLANAPHYSYIGPLGVPTSIRFRFVEDASGGLTYSLGIVRKKNVGSLDISTGLPRTIYIGNAGVTTTSGYPILERDEKFFVVDQNVALYGIAQTVTDLKIFQLET